MFPGDIGVFPGGIGVFPGGIGVFPGGIGAFPGVSPGGSALFAPNWRASDTCSPNWTGAIRSELAWHRRISRRHRRISRASPGTWNEARSANPLPPPTQEALVADPAATTREQTFTETW